MKSFENYVKNRDMSEMAIPEFNILNKIKSILKWVDGSSELLDDFFDSEKNPNAVLIPTFLDVNNQKLQNHHISREDFIKGHDVLMALSSLIRPFDINWDAIFSPEELKDMSGDFGSQKNEKAFHDTEIAIHRIYNALSKHINAFNNMTNNIMKKRKDFKMSGGKPIDNWTRNLINLEPNTAYYKDLMVTKEDDPVLAKKLSMEFYTPARSLKTKIDKLSNDLKRIYNFVSKTK
jgi:hypothetical protein